MQSQQGIVMWVHWMKKCSQTVTSKLEEHADYDDKFSRSDPVESLKEIKKCLFKLQGWQMSMCWIPSDCGWNGSSQTKQMGKPSRTVHWKSSQEVHLHSKVHGEFAHWKQRIPAFHAQMKKTKSEDHWRSSRRMSVSFVVHNKSRQWNVWRDSTRSQSKTAFIGAGTLPQNHHQSHGNVWTATWKGSTRRKKKRKRTRTRMMNPNKRTN